MMYACSCSLAAVSLITTDANEMLTAYGDRESSRILHRSTIYLRGSREGGMRAGGVKSAGISPHPFCSHHTLSSTLGLIVSVWRDSWERVGPQMMKRCLLPALYVSSWLQASWCLPPQQVLCSFWVAAVPASFIFWGGVSVPVFLSLLSHL